MNERSSNESSQIDPKSDSWRTTHWSIVVNARSSDATQQDSQWRNSLELLCQQYWYPLYAYLRRKGYDATDAQDLVQGFFVQLIEKRFLDAVDRQRGRFRWFLMNAVSRYAANWNKKQSAEKRGGKHQTFSFDFAIGEDRYSLEPADGMTPEKLFERRWALTILEQAIEKLALEYEQDGKGRYFKHLKTYLTADSQAPSYSETAQQLGINETTVKVAIFRLREKYRKTLRSLVAQTLDETESLDAEIDDLLSAL